MLIPWGLRVWFQGSHEPIKALLSTNKHMALKPICSSLWDWIRLDSPLRCDSSVMLYLWANCAIIVGRISGMDRQHFSLWHLSFICDVQHSFNITTSLKLRGSPSCNNSFQQTLWWSPVVSGTETLAVDPLSPLKLGAHLTTVGPIANAIWMWQLIKPSLC